MHAAVAAACSQSANRPAYILKYSEAVSSRGSDCQMEIAPTFVLPVWHVGPSVLAFSPPRSGRAPPLCLFPISDSLPSLPACLQPQPRRLYTPRPNTFLSAATSSILRSLPSLSPPIQSSANSDSARRGDVGPSPVPPRRIPRGLLRRLGPRCVRALLLLSPSGVRARVIPLRFARRSSGNPPALFR